jgi:hypothetical protein
MKEPGQTLSWKALLLSEHDSGPEASIPPYDEHSADAAPAFSAFAKSVPMPWGADDTGDELVPQDSDDPETTDGRARSPRFRAGMRSAPSAEPENGPDEDSATPVGADLHGASREPGSFMRRRTTYGVGVAVLAVLVGTLTATASLSSNSNSSAAEPSGAELGAAPLSAGETTVPSATGTPQWRLGVTPTPSASESKPAGRKGSTAASLPGGTSTFAAGVGGGSAGGVSAASGAVGAGSGGGSKSQSGGSGGSAGSSTTASAPAHIELYAGPGCSTDSGATAFVDYSWYSGTNANGTTGWTAQGSGGYGGCSGHYQSMPMSGSGSVTEHASWYFHFSTSITRCQFAVFVPDGSLAQVGGDPADYGYYIGGSESAAGTFSVAQLSHEGSWVIVNTVAVHGGEFEVQEYNAGVDYDSSNWNAHDAVAQMAVSCD